MPLRMICFEAASFFPPFVGRSQQDDENQASQLERVRALRKGREDDSSCQESGDYRSEGTSRVLCTT
jgi:hypothetical protein